MPLNCNLVSKDEATERPFALGRRHAIKLHEIQDRINIALQRHRPEHLTNGFLTGPSPSGHLAALMMASQSGIEK